MFSEMYYLRTMLQRILEFDRTCQEMGTKNPRVMIGPPVSQRDVRFMLRPRVEPPTLLCFESPSLWSLCIIDYPEISGDFREILFGDIRLPTKWCVIGNPLLMKPEQLVIFS